MSIFTAALGPIANLAGSWLQGKADKNAAAAELKLTEAKAKAQILLSKETSVADWERIMAEGAKSSWKDEWFVIILSIPLILCWIPGAEGWVDRGFEQLQKLRTGIFTALELQFQPVSVCAGRKPSLRGSNGTDYRNL